MRTNKWLIGGLVLSLILNLLLVGFVVGRMSGFGPPPGFGPDPTAGFFRLLGFLPDDRRAAIAPKLRKQMGELLPVLRKMRGDQHQVFETLTAEPFDPARPRSGARRSAREPHRGAGCQPPLVRRNDEIADARRAQIARESDATPAPHARMGGDSERREHPPFDPDPGAAGTNPSGRPLATARRCAAASRRALRAPLRQLRCPPTGTDPIRARCTQKHRERRPRSALCEACPIRFSTSRSHRPDSTAGSGSRGPLARSLRGRPTSTCRSKP